MSRMTRRRFLQVVPLGATASALAACGLGGAPPTPLPPTTTPEAPSPEFVGRTFLDAWLADDFDGMYAQLTPAAQAAVSRDDFEARYRGVLAEATVYEIEAVPVAAGRLDARSGAVEFDLLYRTRLVGDLRFRPRLVMELGDDGNWRIAWTPAAIIPDLGDTNRLRLFPRTSTRGLIYDRNGELLATESALVTIGVVPGAITDAGAVQGLISELTGMTPGDIAAKYAGQPADWYVPIADIPFEQSQANYDRLVSTPGISLRERAVRNYPMGTVAAHILGYVGQVSADELTALGDRGYQESDFVGKLGIEKSQEALLAGKKGGRLTVLSPEGNEVATLADMPAVQSRSLYLTIDVELQRLCEAALAERVGSIVMLDVATGQVLAMASYPTYDPNAMANTLDAQERAALAADPRQLLLNRATLGVYPSGSLFKIITMAAGMDLANLPRTDPHFCPGYWDELGFRMACWKKEGHGNIDLYHGLEQSCNVVFFETGQSLYNVAGEDALQEMAARFGIGQTTGLQIDDSPGLLPTAAWKGEVLNDVWVPGDTVNLSIGQGFLQVTPAQMTRAVLAVAAGGAVRPLSLLLRAEDPTGVNPPEEFPLGESGALNLRPETMAALQGAMRDVCVPPMGTASGVFGNFPVALSGKTGTAETVPGQNSHAWFAGYGPTEQPRVVFLGMLEYGGEGSGAAAPMMRGVLDRYFND